MLADITLPNGLFIDGEWGLPAGGEVEEVAKPATETVIGLAPVGGLREVDAAIAAARRAFNKGPWPRLKGRERRAALQAFHDAIMRRATQIKELITVEAGVTRSSSKVCSSASR